MKRRNAKKRIGQRRAFILVCVLSFKYFCISLFIIIRVLVLVIASDERPWNVESIDYNNVTLLRNCSNCWGKM